MAVLLIMQFALIMQIYNSHPKIQNIKDSLLKPHPLTPSPGAFRARGGGIFFWGAPVPGGCTPPANMPKPLRGFAGVHKICNQRRGATKPRRGAFRKPWVFDPRNMKVFRRFPLPAWAGRGPGGGAKNFLYSHLSPSNQRSMVSAAATNLRPYYSLVLWMRGQLPTMGKLYPLWISKSPERAARGLGLWRRQLITASQASCSRAERRGQR